jgi:hypothetical protein
MAAGRRRLRDALLTLLAVLLFWRPRTRRDWRVQSVKATLE